MYESAILVIQKHIEEFLFEPAANWVSYYFAERSYSRWAVYEIMTRMMMQEYNPRNLLGRELKSPIEIINDFISEMDNFLEINNDKQIIFSSARDAAQELRCLF